MEENSSHAVIGSFKADIDMSLYNGKSVNTDFLVIQNEVPGIHGKTQLSKWDF